MEFIAVIRMMQEADNVYVKKSATNMCEHAFNLYE